MSVAGDVKVSVIVPVYNSQDYLRQCLDSIVGQTLRDIEVICVDDGSTDGSAAILEEYAAADSRVTVLHQQNQYAGVARNHGMEVARGEYLAFWDSDDFFEPNALEAMYAAAVRDGADICVCGVNRYYEDIGLLVHDTRAVKKKLLPEAMPFNAQTNSEFIFNFASPAVWNKLMRRGFIKETGLEFASAKSGNDIFFVESALMLAGAITVVLDPLINYRRDREGSLTNTISTTNTTPLEEWVRVARFLRQREGFPEESFANRAYANLLYILHNQKDFDSFSQIIAMLKDGALDELGLREDFVLRGDGWGGEFLQVVRNGSVGDAAICLMQRACNTRMKNTARLQAAKAELREAKRELKAAKKDAQALKSLKESASYRTGRALTAPARALGKSRKRR